MTQKAQKSDDFRLWLYEDGHTYELLGDDGDTARIRGRCLVGAETVRTGGAAFDVVLAQSSGMVHSIDHYAPDDLTVVRRYTAEDITTIDGVLVPGRMRMQDVVRNHETVIELERAWYDHPVDESIFETASRRQTRTRLAEL